MMPWPLLMKDGFWKIRNLTPFSRNYYNIQDQGLKRISERNNSKNLPFYIGRNRLELTLYTGVPMSKIWAPDKDTLRYGNSGYGDLRCSS